MALSLDIYTLEIYSLALSLAFPLKMTLSLAFPLKMVLIFLLKWSYYSL